MDTDRIERLIKIFFRVMECMEKMDPPLRRRALKFVFNSNPAEALDIELAVSGEGLTDDMKTWALTNGATEEQIQAITAE